MKKYSFRLERILQLKEHHESEAKLEFAAVLQKKLNLEQQNDQLAGELSALYKSNFNSEAPGDTLNMLSIKGEGDFERAAALRMKANNTEKAEIEKELETLREKLAEAMKEKKKYEKLKEHDYADYKEFIKKEEIKVLDDIGSKEIEQLIHGKSK